MHVLVLLSLDPDPNPYPYSNWKWILQFVITAFIIVLGFIKLLRSTASKFLPLHLNFYNNSNNYYYYSNNNNNNNNNNINSNNSSNTASFSSNRMEGGGDRKCVVCNASASKYCGACKITFYCSFDCQSNHWKSSHRKECVSLGKLKPQQPMGAKRTMGIALVPTSEPKKIQKVVDKVLFPYDEFVKLYDWDKPIFPPCGLLNCGNSCFANVVLQCLVHTRPLLEYLLSKGHRRDCKRDGWCFLCELEFFMARVSKTPQPFSPMNILSRLRSIGGNLGYGDQEDAHEFMRLSIGAMQSVCLDEHGGERVVDPKSQETTLIQHIFGGQLRSQVICTKCNQVSNQYENMMDLTVEIQGDATCLQECLDQFTSKEWLHGENMYRCDGCKDYVSAWKRLTIHQAPNVLTIALKRFQSGRFGKINKKISFPEILDLSPYMNEMRDGMDIYKLYAVIVHLDMLNASFFGHYICYTKGFKGDWYIIDDCKVTSVELDEVLSQGAYMLLYRRISPRPQCLKTSKPEASLQENGEKVSPVANHSSAMLTVDSSSCSVPSSSNSISVNEASDVGRQLNHVDGNLEDSRTVIPVSVSGLPAVDEVLGNGKGPCLFAESSKQVSDTPSSSSVGVNNKEDSKISLIESTGATKEPEEHRSDNVPLVANTQCSAVDSYDQTALCVMKDGETGHCDFGKVENEGFPDDVEMKSVEPNGSECVSNGVIDDMIIDDSPPNSCLDAPPEKLPRVRD